jgi:hypothetical protein
MRWSGSSEASRRCAGEWRNLKLRRRVELEVGKAGNAAI